VKIVTWNVNGIRAREAQVRDLLLAERPDVTCLQEIKASPEQIPTLLAAPNDYWAYWHGAGPYSGVALLLRRDLIVDRPAFRHPELDRECRIVCADIAGTTLASVYVPNGGKDFAAKMRFLDDLQRWVGELHASGGSLVLCGDLNVTRTDADVHPKERKAGAIGQKPEERELLARILAAGLVDVTRALHPDDQQLFTWWAPWRNLRQRNIGWRIDYVLVTEAIAGRVRTCEVRRETGTSDHAPVIAVLE
jgi:exodeoxyribonuclease-3